MARKVHAEAMRERQQMKNSTPDRTLAGATIRHECRVCGTDHGTDRHTECPECGHTPRDFYAGPWGPTGEFAVEGRQFPFRTDTTWSSKRVEVLD